MLRRRSCFLFRIGWEGWARTSDSAVNRRVLYQLSYDPMVRCYRGADARVLGVLSPRPEYMEFSAEKAAPSPERLGVAKSVREF